MHYFWLHIYLQEKTQFLKGAVETTWGIQIFLYPEYFGLFKYV